MSNNVADCIDSLSCKVALLAENLKRGLNVASSMGAGNRLDPTRRIIAGISKTEVCPLARPHADAISLFIWNRNHVRISKIHTANDNAALMRRYLSADGMPIGSVIEC